MRSVCVVFILVFFFGLPGGFVLRAEDSPQWGEKFSRNMVSAEKNLPVSFNPGKRHPQTGLVDPATTKVEILLQPLLAIHCPLPT